MCGGQNDFFRIRILSLEAESFSRFRKSLDLVRILTTQEMQILNLNNIFSYAQNFFHSHKPNACTPVLWIRIRKFWLGQDWIRILNICTGSGSGPFDTKICIIFSIFFSKCSNSNLILYIKVLEKCCSSPIITCIHWPGLKQCWRSVTFWCGSGSSDPYLWQTDPDGDPGGSWTHGSYGSGSGCGFGTLVHLRHSSKIKNHK